MAGMDRCDFLQLLPAGSADLDELLRALQLLVIGDKHRLHREIFRLGLCELRAKEGCERGTTLDRRAELYMDFCDNTPDNGDYFYLSVGVGHHRPWQLDSVLCIDHLDLGCLDTSLRHSLRRQNDLGRS